MTLGTVPSPPEASTRGAGTGKQAGQGATATIRRVRQDIRLINRVLTSAPEGPVQIQGTVERKPDSPACAQDDGAEEPGRAVTDAEVTAGAITLANSAGEDGTS